jgi:anti-sigma factor RsiW
LEIPVEISLVSLDHPDENVLEEYAFGRLSDAKAAVLEEHMLVCGRCRTALARTDEYIRLMKFALSRPLEIPRPRNGRRPVLASVGALAAACIAVVAWVRPHAQPASVTLASFRGGGGLSVNQAAAGHPLDLSISAADVPPAAHYRLEVVTSMGESIWSGPASAGDGRLAAHFPKSLGVGMYWVRLYAQPAELLAEYGLQVK